MSWSCSCVWRMQSQRCVVRLPAHHNVTGESCGQAGRQAGARDCSSGAHLKRHRGDRLRHHLLAHAAHRRVRLLLGRLERPGRRGRRLLGVPAWSKAARPVTLAGGAGSRGTAALGGI